MEEINEIFTKLTVHMLQGLMIHEQLANYFDFLNLQGYRLQQQHQHMEETKSYREANHFFISHFCQLLNKGKLEKEEIIPESWYKYKKTDVNASILKESIHKGFNTWLKWEEDTLSFYSSIYAKLLDIQEISSALFLKDLIQNVSQEILEIRNEILKMEAVNYDMSFIIEYQAILINKYK